jgi:hypothetical protein
MSCTIHTSGIPSDSFGSAKATSGCSPLYGAGTHHALQGDVFFKHTECYLPPMTGVKTTLSDLMKIFVRQGFVVPTLDRIPGEDYSSDHWICSKYSQQLK